MSGGRTYKLFRNSIHFASARADSILWFARLCALCMQAINLIEKSSYEMHSPVQCDRVLFFLSQSPSLYPLLSFAAVSAPLSLVLSDNLLHNRSPATGRRNCFTRKDKSETRKNENLQ